MLAYLLLRLVGFIFRLCPFWLLYILSDFLYYIFYGLGYRYKVVMSNLERAFPKLSEAERKKIAKSFYRNFTDVLVEGLKSFSLSKEQGLKRFKLQNPDIFDELYHNSKNAIIVGGHLGNWEWGKAGFPQQLKANPLFVFKPIANKRIDDFIAKSRSQYGLSLASAKETRLIFEEREKTNPRETLYFLLADQHPSNRKDAHKVDFFGEKTLFLHGAAKYAQHYNLPVYFYFEKRLARGKYLLIFEELVANPQEIEAEEITQRYAQRLQQTIEQEPSLWLWSHKRWKE